MDRGDEKTAKRTRAEGKRGGEKIRLKPLPKLIFLSASLL